jgi:hypothetical protein
VIAEMNLLKRIWRLLRHRLHLIVLAAAGMIATIAVFYRRRGHDAVAGPSLESARRQLAELQLKRQAADARLQLEEHVAATKDESNQRQIADALADPDGHRRRQRLIELEAHLLGNKK